MRSAGWDRDLRCAAHQLASRILSVFYKHDDAGYQAVLEISGGCRWPRCHIAILVVLRLARELLSSAEQLLALFMTDRKRAAVAEDVFHRAKYPCAFARHAFPECRRIGEIGDSPYMAAAMGVDRGTGERVAWPSKGEGGLCGSQ